MIILFHFFHFCISCSILLHFLSILWSKGQTKHPVQDSYLFFSMPHTSSTKHRSRMTDALLGTSAERKCLEKGGGRPKCNTGALSCFCRHLYFFIQVTSKCSSPPSSMNFQQLQLCSLRCMCIKTIRNVHMHVAETRRCLKTHHPLVASIQSAAFR